MHARGQPPAELLEPLGAHLRVSTLFAVLVGAPATLGGSAIGALALGPLRGVHGASVLTDIFGCSALILGLAGVAVLWGASFVERDRAGDPRRVIRGLSGITIGCLLLSLPGLFGVIALLKNEVALFGDPARGAILIALLVGPLGTAFHASWASQLLSKPLRAWEANAAGGAGVAGHEPPPPAPGT